MNKKAVKTGENPEENELDLEIDEQFEEIDLKKARMSLSYVDRVQDFIRRNELLEVSTVYYLYKFENVQSGQQKAFIAKYTDNDAPDEDKIGREFGSGRYLVVMAIPECTKIPEGSIKAYQIRIHPHYDTLRNKQLAANPPAAQTTIIQQPANNLSDTIDVITKLIGAIAPLLAQRQQQGPDMNALLFKTYENTSEVLKKNMLENVKVAADLQRKLASVENGGSEEMQTDTEEETSLLETLKPLLVEWLPKLIGDNPQAKAVQTIVKTTPQFKQIISNKREFKTLVSYLDQAQGKETTDKILSNLKLKRV